jgi:hypothetical protein
LDLKALLDDTLTNGISSAMHRRMNIFVGYLLKHYFFAAGSGACPLVERNLRTALSELFEGRRTAATCGHYDSGRPRSWKTALSVC